MPPIIRSGGIKMHIHYLLHWIPVFYPFKQIACYIAIHCDVYIFFTVVSSCQLALVLISEICMQSKYLLSLIPLHNDSFCYIDKLQTTLTKKGNLNINIRNTILVPQTFMYNAPLIFMLCRPVNKSSMQTRDMKTRPHMPTSSVSWYHHPYKITLLFT